MSSEKELVGYSEQILAQGSQPPPMFPGQKYPNAAFISLNPGQSAAGRPMGMPGPAGPGMAMPPGASMDR